MPGTFMLRMEEFCLRALCLVVGIVVLAGATEAQVAPHKDAKLSVESPQAARFLAPALYGTSDENIPSSIAIADLNGDGIADVVITSCVLGGIEPCGGKGVVGVLLGAGGGRFHPIVSYDSGEFGSAGVAVADINGDGKLDVVVANHCATANDGTENCATDGFLSVLLGNGDGTLQVAKTYDTGGRPSYFPVSVRIADVDGDGKLDLIATNYVSSTIGILHGNGDGTFQTAIPFDFGGTYPVDIVADDMNGDGKVDLVVIADFFFGSVGVLLGNGDGTFQSAIPSLQGGRFPYAMAVSDLNGDGKPDLAVADLCTGGEHGCGFSPGGVTVFLGNGDGTFKPPVAYFSGGRIATSVAAIDINGDGYADLVLTNQDSRDIGVLLGNGDGTFEPVTTYKTREYPEAMSVADLNGDGKPDVVVAGYTPDGIGVLLNQSGATASVTSIESSPNPSIYGQRVTLAATVASSGTTTPTGKVTFESENAGRPLILGTAMLNSSGTATLTRSNLNVGTYTLIASYSGDTAYLAGKSSAVNQVVTQATSKAVISSSSIPSARNEPVTFTAKITSSTVTPTGPVTFRVGAAVLGTVQLSGGKAQFTTGSLPEGASAITVTYNGDSNIAKSSASVTQIVQ